MKIIDIYHMHILIRILYWVGGGGGGDDDGDGAGAGSGDGDCGGGGDDDGGYFDYGCPSSPFLSSPHTSKLIINLFFSTQLYFISFSEVLQCHCTM